MSTEVRFHLFLFLVMTGLALRPDVAVAQLADPTPDDPAPQSSDEIGHKEDPVEPPDFGFIAGPPGLSEPAVVEFNGYRSVQVNVDANGMNINGDAANEPSIAVDPTNPLRMVIGWRQFDTIASNFRQAGNAYCLDGGKTWHNQQVIEPGQFRSDPVLESNSDGDFFYYSLSTIYSAELFKSVDGGATWGAPVAGTGGDKAWMAIDRTSGIGHGNIYVIWNVQYTCCTGREFARFVDGGTRFDSVIALPDPRMKWGTLDVGPDGTLYSAGAALAMASHLIARSTNAQDRSSTPSFSTPVGVDLGGGTAFGRSLSPNPGGLLGQVWVATDHSDGPTRGNVYMLGSVDPFDADPLDVMFVRSTNGGLNWSPPVRVNDDSRFNNAYQWFGTMSVAPNGRIDVIWYDTRDNAPSVAISALFYSWSTDAGATWSGNVQVSPSFNSLEGHPNQNKIGDYIDMVSDNLGVDIAYSATFNGAVVGEQDVYFLRIGDGDCNDNGVPDVDDVANLTSEDCNSNDVPDECECDCNFSGQPDLCDVLDGSSPDCNDNLIPDICDSDFDGDGWIDDCDTDRDGDGVANESDLCPFTPLGLAVDSWGRPIGSFGACVIERIHYLRFPACLGGPDPQWLYSPTSSCVRQYEYPTNDGSGDLLIDMRDVAEFQKAFGRVGVHTRPDLCP